MISGTSTNRQPSTSRADAAIITVLFLLSRLLFNAAGVSFDSTTLGFFSQLIDPVLLESRLLESVWYLHSQPPLFNLALGVALKISNALGADIFPLLWQITGLAIVFAIHRLTCFLTGSRFVSLAAAIFFLASPGSIVYENWLFYTYPVAALVLLWMLMFARVAFRPTWPATAALGATILALAWTRSLFHIVIVAALLGVMILSTSGESRRRLKIMGTVVLLLIAALYLKNHLLFDRASSSSWLGMSLARISVMKVDSTLRQTLVADGALSPVSLLRPFSPAGAYGCELSPSFSDAIPVLGSPLKRNGQTNYNHYCYLEIEEKYRRDSYHVMTHMPEAYAKGVAAAWLDYFIPSSDFWFRNNNRRAIAGYERIFNLIFFGQIHSRDQIATDRGAADIAIDKLLACGLWLIILIPFSIVQAIRSARRLRLSDDPLERGRAGVLLLAAAMIIVFSLVTNFIEVGENNRIRFEIEPLAIVLVAWVVGRRF